MAYTDTVQLIGTAKKIYPVIMWFKNRYFPTGEIFSTQRVLVDTKKGSRKMAPFVLPRKGGITMEREGYTAESYKPPYIAPKRPLTIDTLNELGFGENPYGGMTPEEREADILADDLSELMMMIDRTEEWMCSELLQHGEVIMRHYADNSYGKGRFEEKLLRFFDKTEGFKNRYTPTVLWDADSPDIYGDFMAMVDMVINGSNPATDINMAGDVYGALIKDPTFQALLNNRRMEIGKINPIETPDGVGYIGQIVVKGHTLDMFVYDDKFEDVDGTMKAFLPAGTVMVMAPDMGKTVYGAISQVEEVDGKFHTYEGTRIPKYISDAKSDTREIKVSSAPVPIPNDVNGWSVATVLKEN